MSCFCTSEHEGEGAVGIDLSLVSQQDELQSVVATIAIRLATLEEQLQASQTLAADVCRLQKDVEILKAKDEGSKGQGVTVGENQQEFSGLPIGKSQENNLNAGPLDIDVPSHTKSNAEYFSKKREYEFQMSVYDAALFIGQEYLTPLCSVLTCLGFVANMVMQLGVVVLISEEFLDEPFGTDEVTRFRYWRAAEGHSYIRADPLSGQSLVARVCGHDPALPMSSSQKSYDQQVQSYLHRGNGRFLCNISILLWIFCCCVEIRMALQFLMAFWILPRDYHRTRLIPDDDMIQLVTLSLSRLVLVFFVAFCRIVIASLLLHYGSQWLAYTDNIEDLLLNASALGFVLEIDEEIFSLFSPSLLLGIMSSLRPVKLPARRSVQFIPLVFLVGIVAVLGAMNLSYLVPVNDSMTDVHSVLCDEDTNLNFVTGLNSLGWLMYAKTPPYESASIGGDEEVMLQSIQLIVDKDPQVGTFAFNLSQEDVSSNLGFMWVEINKPLAELTQTRECLDFKPESFNGVRLGALLYRATTRVSFMQVETCGEIQEYCRGGNSSLVSQNLRFLCPVTCGCADRLSGLWDLAAAEAGCPRDTCNNRMVQSRSADATCEDMDLEQLNSTTWMAMLTRMQQVSAFNLSVLNDLRNEGCQALTHLEDSLRSRLCGHPQPGEPLFLGAGSMCPMACGCWPGNSTFNSLAGSISCPSSCYTLYLCFYLWPRNPRLEEYIGMQATCPETCKDTPLIEGWDCPLFCDETTYDERRRDYRGCQNVTRSGRPCRMWTFSEVERYKDNGLGGLGYHNYCRNPDGDQNMWCGFADGYGWEYCDPVGFSGDGDSGDGDSGDSDSS